MRKLAVFSAGVLVSVAASLAQNPGSSDSLSPLAFLSGTWEAKTTGGQAGASSIGSYTFEPELNGHVLARHSVGAGCSGPKEFDCNHGDLLYVYTERGASRAIYFDNEGHVIHYTVSATEPGTAVFISEETAGPQFRLTYRRTG